MQHAEIYGFIGAAFNVLITLDYAVSVIKNKTRPHAFTWAIWCLTVGIIAVAQWKQGAGPGAWIAGVSAFNCAVIFILSLFKGERNITRGDWIALLSGLAIIPFWQITGNRLMAVILATAIDACGYYPTIRKSWIRPQEEKISMYASDYGRWIFALLASSDFSVTTLIYPVFCLIVNTALSLMIFWRRKINPILP